MTLGLVAYLVGQRAFLCPGLSWTLVSCAPSRCFWLIAWSIFRYFSPGDGSDGRAAASRHVPSALLRCCSAARAMGQRARESPGSEARGVLLEASSGESSDPVNCARGLASASKTLGPRGESFVVAFLREQHAAADGAAKLTAETFISSRAATRAHE